MLTAHFEYTDIVIEAPESVVIGFYTGSRRENIVNFIRAIVQNRAN
jgi:hypothetical protein